MAAPMRKMEAREMIFPNLIQGLQILTTSSASRHNLSEDSSQHLMENVLTQNLASFSKWLPNSDVMKLHQDLCSHWLKLADIPAESSQVQTRRIFADLCTSILKCLVSDLSQGGHSTHGNAVQDMKSCGEPSTIGPQDELLLSLEQKKIVSSSLQFVIVLAISPHLNQGVGIPISHRLGPGQILLASAQDLSKELSEVKRFPYLLAPVQLLVDAFHTSELKDLMVRNHISDLIAGLVQVRRTAKMMLQHSQRCAQCDEREFHPETDNKNKVDDKVQTHNTMSFLSLSNPVFTHPVNQAFNQSLLRDIISFCNAEMDNVFTQANIPIVLQELLTLAGLNKSNKNMKTAPWFRRVVVCMIRDVIMQPGGVLHLISPLVSDLFDSITESDVYDTKNWKTCEAIAKIISHCPVNEQNVKTFYASVSQQLVNLINVGEKAVPQMIVKIVGEAISQLANLQGELMEELCLRPLRAPILRCCSYDEPRPQGHVIISEKELTPTICCMHKVYVQGQSYQSTFCSTLQPVIGVLFAIFKHVKGGMSQLRSLTKDLLGCYLSCLDSSKGVICLLDLLLPDQAKESLYPSLHADLALVLSGSGLQVVVASNQQSQDDVDSWAHSSEAVLDLLTHVKSDLLTSEFFISLLQRLTDTITSEVITLDDILLPVNCLSLETKMVKLTELKTKTALVSMISAIGETYGYTLIRNTHHILLFTEITLKRCLEIYKASEDSATLSFEADTVTMAMGLLMATLSTAQELSDRDNEVLDSLLPMLSTLSLSDCMPFHVKEMAENLKVVVATRGRVWPDPQKREVKLEDIETVSDIKIQKNNQEERQSGDRPLIEVIDDTPTTGQPQREESLAEEAGPKSPLQQSLQDSRSQMVPIQGHGLIRLARLLEDKDAEALQQKDVLLKIFLNKLTHQDSYIYLAAVNGLSALSNLFSDDVVPCLTQEFRTLCQKEQSSKTEETTLKVGEALVKTTRRLGEMAPKYRDFLLPAILCGCSHYNELVRASCLSWLAEVCKLLRFSIHPVLQEVLACCSTVIKSDPCSEPRKAAALTVSSLLQGLGKDSLETLSKGLRELYQALKHAVRVDPDDKVKLQATLALNELEDIMKGILFPEQKLQKTITILGHQ